MQEKVCNNEQRGTEPRLCCITPGAQMVYAHHANIYYFLYLQENGSDTGRGRMDFKLTEEQEMIKKMVRDFAEKEIAPLARENDERGSYPREIVDKLGELGIMGMTIPTEYGGAGADHISYAIAIEELSRVDGSFG
ncbi:MAG: acyl-CoA dehydrogenase family protein, partial [Thermoplasmata archaeon]